MTSDGDHPVTVYAPGYRTYSEEGVSSNSPDSEIGLIVSPCAAIGVRAIVYHKYDPSYLRCWNVGESVRSL